MRIIIIVLFVSLSEMLQGQVMDSLAIHQIDSLMRLSQTHTSERQFEQAEAFNLAATRIAVEYFGSGSESFAKCCFDLAQIYYYQRKLTDAEIKYTEAILQREQVGDTLNPIFINCLNNLGIVKKESGDLKSAEDHFIRANGLRELRYGKEHPEYAKGLNNLASLNRDKGQYGEAEKLYEQSRQIRMKVNGIHHPDYAYTLSDLAILYKDMGNYDKSELLFKESMDIIEKSFGRLDTNFGRILNSTGGLYIETGQLEKAEQCLLEVLAIWERNLGKNHPMYAGCLNNLAIVYKNLGQYERAKTLQLESLALKEKSVGKGHTSYALSLEGLGTLYQKLGLLDEAQVYMRQALSIYKEKLDIHHPSYAAALGNLAVLYEEQRETDLSDAILDEWARLNRDRISNAIFFLSEQELSNYLAKFEIIGNNLGSYLIHRKFHRANCSVLNRIYLEHQLFYKGFLLGASRRLNRLATSSADSEAIFTQLKDYRSQLAVAYSKAARDSLLITNLQGLAIQTEKDLSRSVAEFGEAIKFIQWRDIQSRLAQGEMAIEFVHFKITFPVASENTLYGALLLRAGNLEPEFIYLFDDAKLKNILLADVDRKVDFVNSVYSWPERGLVLAEDENLTLYDLIWKPIEATGLEGVQTIYYSSSGVLHRLNLGAIAFNDETALLDRFNFVALNSTRQLDTPAKVDIQLNDALLVGGINFEADITDIAGDERLLVSRAPFDTGLGSGNRGSNWSYLKWTLKEVEQIQTTLASAGFAVETFSHSRATEEVIKNIGAVQASPRILHLATHGFFFPDPAQGTSARKAGGDVKSGFVLSDNPMIRSGLILASGNYAWQNGKPVSPEKEDGILTAYEISQMNLSNTELVVLSAYETGLGDIQGNEGVYGLQRAFKIAGAKYLIMSLWQVPDRETMEFMTTFYRNWLEDKLSIPEAFRKTQREMRDRFINPYSWAGFVLVE